ncbi:multicopper oxidase family protein [Kribbella sp. NPDC051587]|uniref:multicopper oxidase family protein n=1 Tax=Kribbella sp. NPDC051587 TaxID=3364119 RepID=UPI0037A7749A
MISRRNVLALGVLSAAAAAAPLERLVLSPTSATANAATSSPPIPLFDRALTVPPVLRPRRLGSVDYYDITMRTTDVELLPGATSNLWTYGGESPGPVIKAVAGRPVIVQQRNQLPEPAAVHLHGGNVPSASDGLPGDEIQPGGSRRYLYPNRQPAATLYYHDHVHHLESPHTYRGLTGLYLLTDRAEQRLCLPTGKYDVPLVLQDRLFNADGSLRMPGPRDIVGDVTLVNGRPTPVLEVEQRPYRFRLLNGSSLDGIQQLSLGDGEQFQVIASDGGLLSAPVAVNGLTLSPSERYEIVIDFSKYPIGTQLELRNSLVATGLSPHVMRFDVTQRATSAFGPVGKRLVPVPRLREAVATVRREFVFQFNQAATQMEINGKAFDPNRIDIKPRLGDTEIWTVRNADQSPPIPHVFHTHLVRFQVLDRDGKPAGPLEAGWKDSILINPGESVRLIMRFGDFTGRYLYHCHLLGHADLGMMAQMEVVRR